MNINTNTLQSQYEIRKKKYYHGIWYLTSIFLNILCWLVHVPILQLPFINFVKYHQYENLTLACKQYRDLSICTSPALSLWQRLITFGFSSVTLCQCVQSILRQISSGNVDVYGSPWKYTHLLPIGSFFWYFLKNSKRNIYTSTCIVKLQGSPGAIP